MYYIRYFSRMSFSGVDYVDVPCELDFEPTTEDFPEGCFCGQIYHRYFVVETSEEEMPQSRLFYKEEDGYVTTIVSKRDAPESFKGSMGNFGFKDMLVRDFGTGYFGDNDFVFSPLGYKLVG